MQTMKDLLYFQFVKQMLEVTLYSSHKNKNVFCDGKTSIKRRQPAEDIINLIPS